MKYPLSHIYRTCLMLLCAACISGCIKNDIPYPYLDTEITEISAEGEVRPALIDAETQTVTLYLGETVNPEQVTINSIAMTDGAVLEYPDLRHPLNLTRPVIAVLNRYYDFDWIITAQQTIERYMTVENQIGATVIDVPSKRVVIDVPETTDLSAIKVLSMKLAPENITIYSPDLTGKTVDFSEPVKVTVMYFDKVETWTIYIRKSEVAITLNRIDAWTKVIWAYASGQSGQKLGVQYRTKGSPQWIEVPTDMLTINGGEITARISHLQETTTYEVRAYSGEEFSGAMECTTGQIIEIPNMMLDQWHKSGKIWNPWPENGEQYWDTGNKGATTLGESNVTPVTGTWNNPDAGLSAQLKTEFKGIGAIGKLAAGSVFTGTFMKVDGTNGILNFGRPFTGRPTRLHGYMKYKTAPISNTSADLSYMKGRPDTAQIFIALTDWQAPMEIRTNPKNQQLFDPSADSVIAYGTVTYGYDVEQFTEFTIELDYRATNREPSYILIVCAASKYGDYFTGGVGSTLNVSNLWLDWEY